LLENEKQKEIDQVGSWKQPCPVITTVMPAISVILQNNQSNKFFKE